MNVHGGWKVGAADETLPSRVSKRGGIEATFLWVVFGAVFNRSAGPRVRPSSREKTDDLANLISFSGNWNMYYKINTETEEKFFSQAQKLI